MPTTPTTCPARRAYPIDDVLGVERCDLEEVAVVDDQLDDVRHVVRLGGDVGDDRRQLRLGAVRGVGRRHERRGVEVVLRQVGEELAHHLQAVLLGVRGEVGDARPRGVALGPAELLHGDVLAGDGLDDLRAGDEHVARLAHHEDEVGDRGAVDGAAGGRAHDHGDLRDDPARADVAEEDVGVAAEADDALLDARAARVVDADQRAAHLHQQYVLVEHVLLNPEMVMSLLKQSSKAEKLGDEKIGDADTYHYKVTMDPATLINLLANLAKSTGSDATIESGAIGPSQDAAQRRRRGNRTVGWQVRFVDAPGEGPLQSEHEGHSRSARRFGVD